MGPRWHSACARDADVVHRLIYASSSQVFDCLFNTEKSSAQSFLQNCFVDGAGLFGFRNHTILATPHESVGVAALYDAVALQRMSFETNRQIFFFFGWKRCWRVFRRMLVYAQDAPALDPGVLYLAHLSIAPPWQRRGIATRFVQAQLEGARSAGYRVLALDVEEENVSAQALYRRLGFVPIARYGTSTEAEVLRLPVRLRMECWLGSKSFFVCE